MLLHHLVSLPLQLSLQCTSSRQIECMLKKSAEAYIKIVKCSTPGIWVLEIEYVLAHRDKVGGAYAICYTLKPGFKSMSYINFLLVFHQSCLEEGSIFTKL